MILANGKFKLSHLALQNGTIIFSRLPFSGEDTGKVAAFALALWHLGGCASRVRAAKASGANMIVAHSMGFCASRYREARRVCWPIPGSTVRWWCSCVTDRAVGTERLNMEVL